MKTLLIAFALSSLVTTTSFAAVVSNTFVNPQNGNSYFLLSETTWEISQAEAVTLGGNLVTINDAAENQWLVDTFADPNVVVFWTGLNDIAQEGQFVWVSGEPVIYTNWAALEPNNRVDGNEDWGQIYASSGSNTTASWNVGEWNDGVSKPSNPISGIVEIVPPLFGDIDLDGDVDGDDFGQFVGQFGNTNGGPPFGSADFDQDGDVDGDDFGIFVGNWGTGWSATAVPEPSSVILMSLSLLGLARTSRR